MKNFIFLVSRFLSALILLFLIVNIMYLGVGSDKDTLLVKKKINSFLPYDLCFWGDSKSVFNYNYNLFSKKYPELQVYNFGLSGYSLMDNINFYDNKFCSCRFNIINIEEHTQDNNFYKGNLFKELYSKGITINKIVEWGSINIYRNQEKGFVSVNSDFKNEVNSKYFDESDILEMKISINKLLPIFKTRLKSENQNIILIHPDRKFRKSNYQKFDLDLETMLNEHNINFINIRKLDFLENRELYFDDHHLNKEGSEIFTKYILDNLILIE